MHKLTGKYYTFYIKNVIMLQNLVSCNSFIHKMQIFDYLIKPYILIHRIEIFDESDGGVGHNFEKGSIQKFCFRSAT